MLSPEQKTIISDTNAKFLGVSPNSLLENAGKGIAEEVIKKFGRDISVGILCGLGNNGANGFATANYLNKEGVREITLYLFGRSTEIKSSEAKESFERLKGINSLSLKVKQDCFSDDIKDHDIFLECLIGTGLSTKENPKAKLTKRFADVIKRIVRMKGEKVVIDFPSPGYKWDYSISTGYPKVPDAKVVDIGMPKEVDLYTGPGEVKVLESPKKETHKNQNGKLLIIGGSDTFHGAPIMSAIVASKLVGMVYFYSTPGNKEVISNMKGILQEVIVVPDDELEKYADYADTFLIGPGLEDNLLNRALVRYLLENYPGKTKIIDAAAIFMSPKELLKNSILTPNRGELKYIFPEEESFLRNAKTGGDGVEGKIRRFVKETGSNLILKGHISLLFGSEGQFKMNRIGNAGMAKGGTGDILAGIISALATKNDLWVSMCAGAFISGAAGDLCFKEVGFNFSPTDLIPKVQEVMKWSKEL